LFPPNNQPAFDELSTLLLLFNPGFIHSLVSRHILSSFAVIIRFVCGSAREGHIPCGRIRHHKGMMRLSVTAEPTTAEVNLLKDVAIKSLGQFLDDFLCCEVAYS
jgi:hypothetical protein